MSLGGWAIGHMLFEWIRENVPVGGSVLEFGSGDGTVYLACRYETLSIEQDYDWYVKGVSKGLNLIYAPIVDDWYCTATLASLSTRTFDCVIVDGPSSTTVGRAATVKHTNLFGSAKFIIFDDTHREPDRVTAEAVAKILGRNIEYVFDGEKGFSILTRP